VLVSEALVRVLEDAGTEYVFGVPGSTTVSVISSISVSKKLKFISALHENASLGMADGYARARKSFGVALLHTTPGLTTALPNLYNSFVDDVPILVIVGDVESKSLITEPPLGLGQLTNLASTVTRWSYYAARPSDVMAAIRRALNILQSPEPGPCCIIIPEDVLEERFDGTVVPARFERKQIAASPDELLRMVRMIASARWPVLFVGREVRSKEAVDALQSLTEHFAIPVLVESPYPSAYSVGFPQEHICFQGMFRREAEALRGCDLVIALGGKLPNERKYSEKEPFGPATKIVHINSNPWELGKNLRTDVKVVAHPEKVAMELASLALKIGIRPVHEKARWAKIRRLGRKRAESHKSLLNRRGGTSIKPWHLVSALRRALKGRDYVIVDEGVIASSYLSELLGFTRVESLVGRSAGCLGWGLGAAVGLRLAEPKKKVIAYLGDGALIFGPQALWTACHYDIPLTVVVCNNHGYKSVDVAFEGLQRRTGSIAKPAGTKIISPAVNVAALCRAFGAKARSVVRRQDLLPELESALSDERGVRVVDVDVDPEEKGYEVSLGAASAWT
jgi:benzoylformate decarboxylase